MNGRAMFQANASTPVEMADAIDRLFVLWRERIERQRHGVPAGQAVRFDPTKNRKSEIGKVLRGLYRRQQQTETDLTLAVEAYGAAIGDDWHKAQAKVAHRPAVQRFDSWWGNDEVIGQWIAIAHAGDLAREEAGKRAQIARDRAAFIGDAERLAGQRRNAVDMEIDRLGREEPAELGRIEAAAMTTMGPAAVAILRRAGHTTVADRRVRAAVRPLVERRLFATPANAIGDVLGLVKVTPNGGPDDGRQGGQ